MDLAEHRTYFLSSLKDEDVIEKASELQGAWDASVLICQDRLTFWEYYACVVDACARNVLQHERI